MVAQSKVSAERSGDNALTTASIAEHEYAKKVQALIKLITDLRALGAQSDIDLPRIAVIGNQSAGKSSLVEAMTKISVPRSSGTCTRCPMECRLSHSSEPFKCQIFLRIEKDEFGRAVREVKETKFGPLLRDRSELEVMLRRAQLAILNPSVPKESFVGVDLETLQRGEVPFGSTPQLQFSANVVCLDIFSPDVTNLSFIDLPGIISNVAEGEDPANIDLIKNLVRDNIAGNALILLTITMRDDIQNQSAALLAKEADPSGSRTIGVLTKPDTLQDGEYDDWIDVLAGRKYPLTHGYYVTKQANASELQERPTYERGREREIHFFANQSPWREQDPRIRDRMGVPNITMQLSALLSQLIEKTLPKLKCDTRSALDETLQELRKLPAPPSENSSAELQRLVARFTSDLHGEVRGYSGSESLIQACRPAYESFQMDILRTRPDFVPFRRKEVEDQPHEYVAHVTEEENMEGGFDHDQEPVYLDDVRNRIRCATTRELPFNVPYQAKLYFIDQCFVAWELHARMCFEAVRKVYQESLFATIAKHFEKYSNGGLCDQVRNVTERELDRAKVVTYRHIEWLLELEKDPFTLNEHYLSSYRDKYLTSFRKQRLEKHNNIATDPELIREALQHLAAIGISCSAEQLSRFAEPDPYEQELIMMAEVAAYFRVAYKRIIDNLPRLIDVDFLKGLEKNIHQALINGLRMDDAQSREIASRLLSEDPSVTARRVTLDQVKERLEAISSRLYDFASQRL